MTKLEQAIRILEERKQAVVGDLPPGMTYTDEEHSRRLFVGLDIDYDEFVQISHSAGGYFAQAALAVPLPEACRAAWIDGLLIGLMFSQLRDE